MTASVIGTRPLRHDGIDKVTGRALYGADVRMPRLLHGHVVRSPHAHARILSIDATRALALPGVKAVISAADFPEDVQPVGGAGVEPLAYLRDNILASHKALYKGHAVAAIAATSPHIAAQAAELVEVRYEVLPTVLTGLEAMRSGAPRLHDDLRTKEPGEPVGALSNVAKHVHHAWGDVDAGFAEAAVVVERSFDTATVHQGYIEPHNATAVWNHDDRILIWCSTQGAFGVRDVTARVLDVPISRVTVYPMEIGGGFGGKLRVYLEPVAALLSRKAGCPVKIVMSRADVFEGTGPAPASHVDLKIGARDDGRITAAQASLIYEAGAFPGAMVGLGALCVFAAYDIPNIAIEGFDVVVNKPSTAAYRAPGAPNAAFATETVLDEIAERLALDPIELRLLNIAREGTRRADGVPHGRIGGVEVLEAMRRHLHYRTPLGRPYRGRGIALGYWINEGHPSCCSITPNADGTTTLLEGSVDIGGTRTSIAMQAAEVLGIPAEHVRPIVADTDSIGFTDSTGGSRTTFATGWAACAAADDLLRQMKAFLTRIWRVESIVFDRGVFRCGEHCATFAETCARIAKDGAAIVGRGAVDPTGVGASLAGCIVDVEVDPETGHTTVLRVTSVQDAGRAIHPSYVEGQMQGGTVQGIGWALNEQYCVSRQGAMLNSTLLDYCIPTALDLPMIETEIVEVPNPGHPFGVRGVGEASIVPPPAAVANAIYHAIGVRMTRLPMTPQAVVERLGILGPTTRAEGAAATEPVASPQRSFAECFQGIPTR